jgi:hypothetical protein
LTSRVNLLVTWHRIFEIQDDAISATFMGRGHILAAMGWNEQQRSPARDIGHNFNPGRYGKIVHLVFPVTGKALL